MILSQTCLHRARVSIELTSPMMIATGQSLNTNDNDLVRDENGWPMIPGTSLAGVLRSLMVKIDGAAATYFGIPENTDPEDNTKVFELSGIQVSAGLVHNSQNQVQEAIKTEVEDDMLRLLASDVPMQRNGVAINNRGVAQEKSKHDRTLVPTGTRFTFEISWWAEQLQPQQWQNLLSLLAHPMCALGGGTRIGQGTFKLIALHEVQLDLTDAAQAGCFRGLDKSLAGAVSDAYQQLDTTQLQENALNLLPLIKTSILLAPENGWRIGGGHKSLQDEDRTSGIFPYTEAVIKWLPEADSAAEEAVLAGQVLVLPGSTIKGAFAHRLEFHFRRLQGLWAEKGLTPYRDTDIKHLLGWIDGKHGQVGHLWFADCYVPGGAVKQRTRNKIDRLTGGTINQALFVEERVYSGPIDFCMYQNEAAIDALVMSPEDEARIEQWKQQGAAAQISEEEKRRLKNVEKTQLPPDKVHAIREAIAMTLNDLTKGRLAVGAGQNNGAGYFTLYNDQAGTTQ